jgi:hypothetical protein
MTGQAKQKKQTCTSWNQWKVNNTAGKSTYSLIYQKITLNFTLKEINKRR